MIRRMMPEDHEQYADEAVNAGLADTPPCRRCGYPWINHVRHIAVSSPTGDIPPVCWSYAPPVWHDEGSGL